MQHRVKLVVSSVNQMTCDVISYALSSMNTHKPQMFDKTICSSESLQEPGTSQFLLQSCFNKIQEELQDGILFNFITLADEDLIASLTVWKPVNTESNGHQTVNHRGMKSLQTPLIAGGGQQLPVIV